MAELPRETAPVVLTRSEVLDLVYGAMMEIEGLARELSERDRRLSKDFARELLDGMVLIGKRSARARELLEALGADGEGAASVTAYRVEREGRADG